MSRADPPESSSRTGLNLSLGVGLVLLGAAAVVALTGGEIIIVTILALIGGSALAGWAKARKRP